MTSSWILRLKDFTKNLKWWGKRIGGTEINTDNDNLYLQQTALSQKLEVLNPMFPKLKWQNSTALDSDRPLQKTGESNFFALITRSDMSSRTMQK